MSTPGYNQKPGVCYWTQHEDFADQVRTSCDNICDKPEEGFLFCMFCGKRIRVTAETT